MLVGGRGIYLRVPSESTRKSVWHSGNLGEGTKAPHHGPSPRAAGREGSVYSPRRRVRANRGSRFPWTQARMTADSSCNRYQITYGKRRRIRRRFSWYRSGSRSGFRRFARWRLPPRFGTRRPDLALETHTNLRWFGGRAPQPDGRRRVPSTATLFEAGLNLRPRALILRVCLQISESCVE